MALKNSGYFPAAGAQQPHKYPRVGQNYLKYGEQPDWVYSPQDDTYRRSPEYLKKLHDYNVAAGLEPPDPEVPKQPSLFDAIAPVAGTAAALYAGKELGSGGFGFLKDAFSGFGGGASAAATPTAATQGATSLAAPEILSASQIGGAPVAGAEAAALPAQGGLLAAAAPLALGAIAAYTAKSGYDAYKDGEGGLSGGVKAWKDSSPFIKYNPLLAQVPFLGGLLGHQSMRDIAKKHTGGLLSAAAGDQSALDYISGMRKQYESAPPDPSKPFFGGKYGSFDEYKAAGLNAADLAGVYGNIKVDPVRYANLSQQQKEAFTQRMIDANNYRSSKGEVELINEELGKAALDEILKAAPLAPGVPGPTSAAQLIPRSTTRSPGIGLDGRPVSTGGLLSGRR